MSTEARKEIRLAFEAYPQVLPLLEQAATAPDYNAELDYTSPPEAVRSQLHAILFNSRSVIRVLRIRAEWLAAEGDGDGALETCRNGLRLLRHFSRNPFLVIYYTVAAEADGVIDVANLTLQHASVSRRLRNVFDAELAMVAPTYSLPLAIRSERALVVDFVRTHSGEQSWILGRAIWNHRASECLQFFTTFLALADNALPFRRTLDTIRAMPAKRWNLPWTYSRDTVDMACRRYTKAVALSRCLRIINALQNHAPFDGKKAPMLSQLGLPPDTFTDPYNDNPLYIKPKGQGWLVYSVGADFRDDGGELAHDRDVGLGP
jgi:hypothetical protein